MSASVPLLNLQAVQTVQGMNVLGMAAAAPTSVSKTTTGLFGVGIPAGTAHLALYASAAGPCMNYNAAATTTSCQVPTAPLDLGGSTSTVAAMQFVAPAANTAVVSIIFLG